MQDDRGNFEKKDPDSGMKKGTIVCCKEVGKAIPTKDGRLVLWKEARKSIPSTARNGPTMKDDRRDFPKDIWNQSTLSGRNEWEQKAYYKEIDQAGPVKVWNDRAIMDGEESFEKT